MAQNLILASSSKYRQMQLASLGINAKAIAPNIDETPLHEESPQALAQRLANGKAAAIAKHHPDALVIGSDQVACLEIDNEMHLLSKPGTYEKAKQQLTLCSGHYVTFYSALAIHWADQNKLVCETDVTKVHFRDLDENQIRQYLIKEQPYDCAGSFKSEGIGVLLFDKIESRDPNALIGLPVMLLRELLAYFDVDLLSLATQ